MLESRHTQLYYQKFLYPRQLPLPPNNSTEIKSTTISAPKTAGSSRRSSRQHSDTEDRRDVCNKELSLPATPTFTRRTPRPEKEQRKTARRHKTTKCSCSHHENKDPEIKPVISREISNQVKGKTPQLRRKPKVRRENVVLESVKVNIPLRQSALDLEEELYMPHENKSHQKHLHCRNPNNDQTKNPMLSKIPRTQPDSDHFTKPNPGSYTKKCKSRSPGGEEKRGSPSFLRAHVPAPQPIVMRCRKTLPEPPSGKLLEEITVLKEVLRRKHLSQVS
ncbi:hypothetical protein ACHWQZ_G000569 [Mnemiopsis leidyi]